MELIFDRFASLGYMTNLVGRLLIREISGPLAAHGLSVGYMPIFFALAAGEALTQRDLAIAAQVEQPTMAATLARMQRDGLIERRANPDDRRSALIFLSEAGHSKLPAVHAAATEANGRATAQLSAEERGQLLALLTRVAETLGPIS
ncbi:MAG TPA: MarR family transcriptional regulator [Devosia sp.]